MKKITFSLTYSLLFVAMIVNISCEPPATEKLVSLDSLSFEENNTIDSTFIPEWSEEDEILGLGKVHFGDLDSMIERRYIRALVPYTKIFYFIDGKERHGMAYDALNIFEKELNQALNFHPPKVRIIFMPVSREQLIPLLNNGYGDVIVAGFTITDERKTLVDFSIPNIKGLKEVVVASPTSKPLNAITDLSGQQVFVHNKSSYQNSILKLNDSLTNLGLEPVQIEMIDPYLEKEDLLEMVDAGLIPFTIVESDIAQYWSEILDSLVVYPEMAVNNDVAYGWAFRKNSPKLKSVIDKFINHANKGSLTGNILYDTYLKKKKYLNRAHSTDALKQLALTQNLFEKYADQYNLDWLLLAAQGYQESGLDQNVKSSAGAIGIMQIKPSTAAGNPINIHQIDKMENNIHAGAKYLRFLMDRYFKNDTIDDLNQHLLALAAYNAGPARLNRLRQKCADQGLDPNIWFNNVEKIAAHEIGRETVQYVSNIYKYYTSYRALKEYSKRSGKKLL